MTDEQLKEEARRRVAAVAGYVILNPGRTSPQEEGGIWRNGPLYSTIDGAEQAAMDRLRFEKESKRDLANASREEVEVARNLRARGWRVDPPDGV